MIILQDIFFYYCSYFLYFPQCIVSYSKIFISKKILSSCDEPPKTDFPHSLNNAMSFCYATPCTISIILNKLYLFRQFNFFLEFQNHRILFPVCFTWFQMLQISWVLLSYFMVFSIPWRVSSLLQRFLFLLFSEI